MQESESQDIIPSVDFGPMVRYVTYLPDGTLDGSYLQEPTADHVGHMIIVTEEQGLSWYLYRANAARDGIELIPPAIPDPVVIAQQIILALKAQVQQHLDTTAYAWGYDTMLAATTYADEPIVEDYRRDGQALRAWRSLCWRAAEVALAEVQAGTRTVPTGEELLAMLPAAPVQQPRNVLS